MDSRVKPENDILGMVEIATPAQGRLAMTLQTKGKDVLKKIEKATQETKTLTAKTGAEVEEEIVSITEDQIPYLSDEELKQLKKKLTSKRA